ncbi:hypothetical protein Unana1_05145 [Umbelopsis nana]
MLISLAFVAAFIFLYRIGDHPRIVNTLQPTAYYDQYDEPVCLPEHHISKHPPPEKAKAAFVVLIRNSEQEQMVGTIKNLEEKFNKNFNYPYVFLNNDPFTEEFKDAMTAAAPHASMEFGEIPKQYWSYPSWVNQTKAAECRQRMDAEGIYYGGSESYRHMCRFNSGFFFKHHLLDDYDWYWRVEPGVRFYCDITYDPFLFMQKHKKQYGFVITLLELKDTIPTLWDTVLDYAKSRKIDLGMSAIAGKARSKSLFPYFLDETNGYNLCHFWSNFEIGSLNLWRSSNYQDFFSYLDQTGNFFYERWGDAPVHSLAAGLFLDTDQIHYFEDFGYQHDKYRHCPSKESGKGCRCECPSGTNDVSIDHDKYWDSCLPKWREWEKISKKRWGGWN